MSHFWAGSFCRCYSDIAGEYKEILNSIFPRHVVGASGVVQISNDIGNNIQDRSWMLYLLESFDSGTTASNNFPIELNLICQFNEFDHFWAIFAGVNKYRLLRSYR